MRKKWRILPAVLLALAVGGVGVAQVPEVEIEKEIVPRDSLDEEMMGEKMIRKYILPGDIPELELTGLMGLKGLKALKGLKDLEGLEGLEGLEALEGLEGLEVLMQTDLCCPMMLHSPRAVDRYLRRKDELGLSEEQVESLKSIKDSHQREMIRKKADLELAMLDLENLLSEEDIDLSKAESLTKKIGSLRAEMRFKGIEAAVKAKRILTEEQREKLKGLGSRLLEKMHRINIMSE